jgi:NADH-quinone oxidoreductase subunit H
MRWLRALAVLLGVGLLVVLVAASGGFVAPGSLQLLRVTEVTPREVEVGDRLSIAGDGFPPGRAARVTFRGTLHRPGEGPERAAEIVAPGTVASPERVLVAVDESLQALFCGAGDRAAHVTFEGEAEVAFASTSPGQPPVAGVLHDVVLDVQPPWSAVQAARESEGARVVALLGIHAAASAHERGLAIEGVDPGSRAAAAGLQAGDVVTRVDGVRVASPADVVPAPAEREASFAVLRGGAESLHAVPVAGALAAAPEDLGSSILAALAALAFVTFFAAPAPGAVAVRLQTAVARLRAAARARRRDPRAAWGASWAEAARSLAPSGPALVVDVVACASLLVLPFGEYLIAARLDVGMLFVVAAAALVAAALARACGTWRGLRAALHVAWQHLPAALAIVAAVVVAGSFRVQEIARMQGGWPWEWLAFRSPASLLACALLLLAARIDPAGVDPSETPEMLGGGRARLEREGTWVSAGARAHRLIVCGLACALFLGGWALPGVAPSRQEARQWLEMLGALTFAAKVAGAVITVSWSQIAFPAPGLAAVSRATAMRRLPLALVALAATAGWTALGPARSTQALASGALVLIVGLALAGAARWVLRGVGSTEADVQLSPFL